jgi:hypothetical protein
LFQAEAHQKCQQRDDDESPTDPEKSAEKTADDPDENERAVCL